jgi:ankyrin repeat protein
MHVLTDLKSAHIESPVASPCGYFAPAPSSRSEPVSVIIPAPEEAEIDTDTLIPPAPPSLLSIQVASGDSLTSDQQLESPSLNRRLSASSSTLDLSHARDTPHTVVGNSLVDAFLIPEERENKDDQETKFFEAILSDDVDTVGALLFLGVRVDIANGEGNNALHHAAFTGSIPMYIQLLEKGVIAGGNHESRWPIHLAAAGGFIPLVSCMIEKGESPFSTDSRGATPLHDAILCRKNDVASFFVEKYADLLYTADHAGCLPLHYAVRDNNAEITSVCLKMMQTMQRTEEEPWMVIDASGVCSLLMAVQKGNVPIVEVLVESGAQLETTFFEQQTLLHIAAEYGHADMLRWLCCQEQTSFRLQDLFSLKDGDQSCPIQIALMRDQVSVLEYVCAEYEEWPSLKDDMNRSMLHIICQHGARKCLLRLLEFPSPIVQPLLWETCFSGGVPLHLACEEGSIAVIKVLWEYMQEHPADATHDEWQDFLGRTPLHYAFLSENSQAIDWALKFFSHLLDVKDTFEMSARELASQRVDSLSEAARTYLQL